MVSVHNIWLLLAKKDHCSVGMLMREEPGGVGGMNSVSMVWSSRGELGIKVGGVVKVGLGTMNCSAGVTGWDRFGTARSGRHESVGTSVA